MEEEPPLQFALTEEQEAIRETVREFALEKVAPAAARHDEEETFPHELIRELASLDLLGVPIPEEYGGAGAGYLAYAITIEELSSVDAATGTIVSAHTSLACGPLQRWGTEEQKEKYLRPLASGRQLGAFALTEASSGTDAASMRTVAVRRGDCYVLNGSKLWITNAGAASTYIVFARTDPSAGHRGMTAFIVDKEAAGLTISRPERKLGIHAAHSCELYLENVEAPVADRLGQEGEGFKIALGTLDGGRVGIAAQAVGIGQGCLNMSIQYARERQQFGRPIGEFQAIQWKLADMATRVQAARLLTYGAAAAQDRGEPVTQAAAMAKLFASEMCVDAAREAVQIHGGMGYSKEYPVERFYRDAKITEIYEGTSEAQRMVIASRLLK